MNTHTQSTPENVKARLTLDVTCLLNGEAASEILARLQRMWVRAIGERLLIDETAAKVDVWSIEVTELPSATNSDALEAEIAAFMQQRIGDGNLCAEDIPLRLASYGLMAPRISSTKCASAWAWKTTPPRPSRHPLDRTCRRR